MSKYRDETAANLGRYGITQAADIAALIRCSSTLHTWAERECNGEIQRDEVSERPWVYNVNTGEKLYAIPDREARALERAAKIAAKHNLRIYHQGDPRGVSLYLYRETDLPQCPGSNSEVSNGQFCPHCSASFKPTDLYTSVTQQPARTMVPAHRLSVASCYNSYGVAVVP